MESVYIKRAPSSDQGTPGILIAEGFSCRTLELPWKDNIRKLSCIPEGEYNCKVVISPKFGRVYHVQKVPGRSEILLHAGNLAGSIDAGYRAQVQGCILLGRKFGLLDNQQAILYSRPTVTDFMERMKYQPFKLIISSVGE